MTGIFGETFKFKQEKGPEVSLVVNGDEHYARYETEDGYTVVYDTDLGLYCYAIKRDGKFVSSKIPVSEPPPMKGLNTLSSKKSETLLPVW